MTIDDITSRLDELLIIVGAIGVAAEGTIAALLVLVRALRGLAASLAQLSVLTTTLVDDRAVGRLARGLDWAAEALERVQRIIPRLRLGARRGESQAPPVDPRGTAMLGVLLVVLASTLGGCGMSAMDATRASVATTARMTTAVDPIIAAAYETLADGLDAGTVDAEDGAVRMRRLDRAERALASLRHALIAVDLSLDAGEAGAECGLQAALDGAVSAIAELLRALDSAGLEVPALLHIGVAFADGYVDPVECTADDATTAALVELRAAAL